MLLNPETDEKPKKRKPRKSGVNKSTLLKAIQKKCLECCCGITREVRECNIVTCPIWEFRNPTEVKKKEVLLNELLDI